MGYTCASCGKYERNDTGPCRHCGTARKVAKLACIACQKEIQPGRNKGDFCIECWRQQTSHCHECFKEIQAGDKHIFLDNQQYHRNCYTRDINCSYCKGPIIGELKQVLDKNYHSKCWICTGCSKKLEGAFEERNGWPWCPSCAKNTQPEKITQLSEEEKKKV